MGNPVKTIAAVQGAPGAMIQEMFRTLVDWWRPSVRLAGVLAEGHGLADRTCSAGFLRNIGADEQFPIFQDRGAGSTGCHLIASGVLSATAAVRRDIAAGCDLVLLNKFGKLEAAGEGLLEAFNSAIEADIPILTSVSPAFEAAWEKFAAPLFTVLPADPVKIDAWRQAVRTHASDLDRNAGR